MQPNKAFSNMWGRLLWALIVVLLASPIDASAQRTNGALKGVITDPQGDVIPGATVTVLGQETKLENTPTAILTNNYSAKDVVNLPNAGGLLNGSPLNLAVLAPNTTAQPGGVAGTTIDRRHASTR